MAAKDCSKQSSLNSHLEERHKEILIPYSDSLLREAAIEWLIVTDQVIFIFFNLSLSMSDFKMQPLQALDHLSFQKMIDIAARTTKGINIPNCKATRKHIIELFKKKVGQFASQTHSKFSHKTTTSSC